MWWTSSIGSIELEMTEEQAMSVFHSGDCEPGAITLAEELKDQLDKLDANIVKEVLLDTGGWEDKNLQDNELNILRLVWLAGCDLMDS